MLVDNNPRLVFSSFFGSRLLSKKSAVCPLIQCHHPNPDLYLGLNT